MQGYGITSIFQMFCTGRMVSIGTGCYTLFLVFLAVFSCTFFASRRDAGIVRLACCFDPWWTIRAGRENWQTFKHGWMFAHLGEPVPPDPRYVRLRNRL